MPQTKVNAASQLQNELTVDAREYGVKADGTTDNTTSIGNAIAATPSGGVLEFPTGVIASQGFTITTNISIRGQGKANTHFIPLTGIGSNYLITYNCPSNTALVNGTTGYPSGLTIEGFTIDLTGFASASGITLNGMALANVNDLLVYGGTNGVNLNLVTLSRLYDMFLQNMSGIGLSILGDNAQSNSYSDIKVWLDSGVAWNMSYGIKLVRTNTTYTGTHEFTRCWVTTVSAAGNYINNGFVATSVSSLDDDIFIRHCIFDAIYGDAMQIVNIGGVKVIDNWIASTAALPGAAGNAVTIDGGTGLYNFDGNRFLAPAGSIFNLINRPTQIYVGAGNLFEDCPNYIFKLPGSGMNYPTYLHWEVNLNTGVPLTNDPSGLLFALGGASPASNLNATKAPFTVWTWPYGNTLKGYYFNIYDGVNGVNGTIRNNNGVITSDSNVIFPGINLATSSGGSNNAPICNLGETIGTTPVTGTEILLKLSASLQAGANTLAVGGLSAVPIKSSRNPANNISTGYVSGGWIHLVYDSTGPYYLDLSQ